MSLSSALGEIAWKKEPRTCRADATPAEGAGRCVGTRGSGVAAEGNWLLLGAEVSRNLTQALVAPTGMGHGAWVRARNVQAGRQAEFAIRRPKGLHSTGTANRLGLVWNKVAALNTGTGRNRGFVEAEYVVRKLYAIAGADNALGRTLRALWYGELRRRFGTENCVGAGPHRHSFAVTEAADIGGGKACCP